VHLNEVIERTLALRAYELKLENIEVELALDARLPETLADAAQLQQVVLNLIVNAEQAIVMARGDESHNGRILIRTRRLAGDRLAMEVSDDGPGIPPEIVPRIFDPFFTTKPPGVGTGLGLSIVYGIVQEHGGEISVDSLQGRGATLTVELPALSVSGFDYAGEEPVIEPRTAPVAPLRALERTAARKHILVVEDEPTVADLRLEDAVRGRAGALSRADAPGEPDATQGPVCHGRHHGAAHVGISKIERLAVPGKTVPGGRVERSSAPSPCRRSSKRRYGLSAGTVTCRY
jgi:anti-sigma regulatory factor (Ser/Thr protein kinase)